VSDLGDEPTEVGEQAVGRIFVMDRERVESRLKEALVELRQRDEFLLASGAAERSVVAKLACYLVPRFPTYDVDVEYNRHGLVPKRLNLPPGWAEDGVQLIVPDLIIHRRGHDRDNLLVAEVKKSMNVTLRDHDRAKIRELMERFSYRYGVLLEIPTGVLKGTSPKFEWL
jgi:hypothetical protein